MAKKRPDRDPKYSRTFGEKPHVGRRYVENGRVRIEWREDGRRRRRSFGDNSPEATGEADTILGEILEQMQHSTSGQQRPDAEPEPNARREPVTVEAVLRSLALSVMDSADRVAEWIRPEK